jgi:predicted PhzF superfamily epimerase YddE/YHI9
MAQPIVLVDSFTDRPFAGNPAGVCVLAAATTETWMQSVATELNASETAFVVPRPDGDHDLRWFSPTTEVDLCGHATLASAHVLGDDHRFHTRSGPLVCRAAADGSIEMDFPALPVTPLADPPDVASALGLEPDRIVAVYGNESGWLLAELASAADVRAVVPDLAAVRALGGFATVVAAPGEGEGIDSVCRVFAPGAGIDEDPVTGSAHCLIGPLLAARSGRTRFTGEQASSRGGIVGMRVEGDRVVLSGRAVTVLEGTLHEDPPPA